MASAALIDALARDEGLRLKAYPDPRSALAQACIKARIDFTRNYRALPGWEKLSGAPWTIGCGHTGPEVNPDLVWTDAQARAQLVKDADGHSVELLRAEPWIAKIDAVRQDVLFNMAFNMGVGFPPTAKAKGKGLRAFINTLAKVRSGDFAGASMAMLASPWAVQVGGRAQRLAKEMRTGAR